MVIKHNKKEYKLIDLKTEFTLRQQKIARGFLVDIITSMQSDKELANFTEMFQKFSGKEKLSKKEETEITRLNMLFGAKMLDLVSSIDYEAKILALVFIEKNEKLFNVETYERRLVEFETLLWDDNFNEVISDFFTLKIPSLMKSFLTSFKAISQLKGIA